MRFLLVNPFVLDFACYDYWLKPLGLLYLSAILKKAGHEVELVDCMDRHSEVLPDTHDDRYGKGKFILAKTVKPDILKQYPRKYSIYGIYGSMLNNILKLKQRPDMILLTCTMTYWYIGAAETANILRETFPGVPLIIGGAYATLCPEHAAINVDADKIITGSGFSGLFDLIGEETVPFEEWPAPDYSHYRKVPYVVMRTSIGCPNRCTYCSIDSICPEYRKKDKDRLSEEVGELLKYQTDDFVFYDDALLSNNSLYEFLETAPQNLRFHTPNGMEVKKIDSATARLLKKAGFTEPCISVDIIDEIMEGVPGAKLRKHDIEISAENLFSSGYRTGEVHAYLILGRPGQDISKIKDSVRYLHKLGLKVRLAEYAVVPQTADAEGFPGSVISEPLLHNNSIFPSYDLDKWDEIFDLKEYTVRINDEL
ncbi:MAG: radical SAM protein [Elusimicrobiota bacterium]